jgi:DNA-binding beta-propeller fold protein YncE
MIDLSLMSKQEKIIISSLLVLIILLVLVMFSSTNTKAERKQVLAPQNIITGGGAPGSDRGYFSTPKDIAVDKDGNIYVVDSRNNRVQKFSKEGNFLISWGKEGNGPGDLKEPNGIDIGPDGNIYVADTWNGRIEVFNPAGSFIKMMGQDLGLWGPRDVGVDRQGNVYALDTGNFVVYKMDPAGKKLAMWGKKRANVSDKGSSEPGFFYEPFSIKQGPDGNMYVADRVNFRIQVISTAGKFIREIKVKGWSEKQQTENGCLMEPFLDIDQSTGNIFVTDSTNSRVIKYGRDGVQLKSITESIRKEKLKCPYGIAVFTGGQLLVTDSGQSKIFLLQE